MNKERIIQELRQIFSKQAIIDYCFIIIGAFIMALGVGVFLVDAKVVPGGVSGLAMAVHYLSGNTIPVGLMMWVFNIPLYIWGVRVLGKQFGIRTVVGFTMNSFFIDFVRGRVPGFESIQMHLHPSIVQLRQNDFLLLILTGAVLVGLGLGIIFKFRGTTAGSDVVAAVARKRFGINPGATFMTVDFVVIVLAGIVIHVRHLSGARPALTLTLYAFVLLFVSSRIVDVIIDGFDYARSAFIMSKKTDEISRVITRDFSRGVTAFEARGLYKDQKREVLYTVLTRKEITELTRAVKEVDPNAFVIVNNVHEVLGNGFRPRI